MALAVAHLDAGVPLSLNTTGDASATPHGASLSV